MKKKVENKIKKCIQDNNLQWDINKLEVLWNGAKLNEKKSMLIQELKKCYACDITYNDLIEYSQLFPIDLKAEAERIKEEKKAETEKIKQFKLEEKERKLNAIAKKIENNKLGFKLDKDGNVKKCFENYIIAINEVKPDIKFNEFTQTVQYLNEDIQDNHIPNIRLDVERICGLNCKSDIEDAITQIAMENTYHPVKEAIEKYCWDGKSRVESFFIDSVGAADTPLNRKMTKNFFYLIIKRLYEPGCVADNMLIVWDYKQGTGKSKIMENFILTPCGYGYDSTVTPDSSDKDNIDKMNKAMIIAFEEMAKFDKYQIEEVKAFITASSDTARLSYGRRSQQYKRHCVFYGNSNQLYCLNDYTDPGGYERRFWFIECDGDPNKTEQWWKDNFPKEYYEQVWAESLYMYLSNPNMSVMLSPEEKEELRIIQNRHKKLLFEDVSINDINEVLEKKYKLENGCFKNSKDAMDQMSGRITYNETEIPDILTQNDEDGEFFSNFLHQKESKNDKNESKNDCFLTKIRVVDLKKYIERELKRSLTTQKLTFMMKNYMTRTWEYKQVKYLGVNTYCYVTEEITK